MTAWMLLAAMAQDGGAASAMIARARSLTQIVQPCRTDAEADEIVVCAARTADRFRVPLTTPPAEGDPKAVDALGERERLLAVPQPACGTSAFLQGCGFAGVTASTRRGGSIGRARPLAK
jgi:D-tyrosyl-tRNA(Tyr) deacylase